MPRGQQPAPPDQQAANSVGPRRATLRAASMLKALFSQATPTEAKRWLTQWRLTRLGPAQLRGAEELLVVWTAQRSVTMLASPRRIWRALQAAESQSET
mmetsp:Transcript_41353/g.73341  ORF Transcript_41353/g.73341 Transcript_41353/m.73341 type:complete len:99 (-) Transcript_41353:226-522(-)